MKIVFWIFAIVAVVFTIDFVMTNGQLVLFGSWLLPWQAEMSVGLAVLCALAAGLIIGGVLSWSSASRARRRAQAAERRVEGLERELGGLVRRAEDAQRDAISIALREPVSTGDGTVPDAGRTAAGAGTR